MFALLAASLLTAPAGAYYNNFNWSSTATDGSVNQPGEPITLTWSLADDGTIVPNVVNGQSRTSDLIASLDGWFGSGVGGADLTQRPWFGYLQSSLDAWGEASGLTLVYEPNDDGAVLNSFPGELGVRGDIRLAGARYDGTVGSNRGVLGFTIGPDFGGVFLDTDDVAYFSNPANDAFSLRHTLMHEVGHILGLGHLFSSDANVLMEAFPQTSFDGPQLDDRRGIQAIYGDPLEAAGGNNARTAATPLGVLAPGLAATVGADGELIDFTPTDNDLVSIHRSSDRDFYAVEVETASRVDVTLTPVGHTYSQSVNNGPTATILADRVGDLDLDLYRGPSLVDSIDDGSFGATETLSFVATPGDSFAIEVSGLVGAAQLYRLDVVASALGLEGDYNADGLVDAADYVVWRNAGPGDLVADGDADGLVDARDFAVWAAAYGTGSSPLVVPEPGSGLLALAGVVFAQRRRA